MCPESLSGSILRPPISNSIWFSKSKVGPEQFELHRQLSGTRKGTATAYSLFKLGKPLWVDLVSLEFLKHRLGQYRQLVAETTSGHANMFTGVKEVEAQLSERGIINIFGDGIREQLAEELGEGGVSG
jgi:hypothetical protein